MAGIFKMSTVLEKTSAAWIWPSECGSGPNQYVEFRHDFNVSMTVKDADLLVCADSNYAVWLNGVFVDCGQYHDYPQNRKYDCLQVGSRLLTGNNSLVFMVYYQGDNSFQYVKGRPGLAYALCLGRTEISSGTETSWRRATGYRNGPISRVTGQLGFTFEYDARRDGGDWNYIQAQDLVPLADTGSFSPRPIPKIQIKGRVSAIIHAQGLIAERKSKEEIPARLMQTDFLSSRNCREIFKDGYSLALPSDDGIKVEMDKLMDGGVYFVIDLDREEVGFLEIDMDADDGTVIDIANGEHLDDLRVRSCVGGRNFAHRYTCKEGHQVFTHYFLRLAGRFLQLHVTNVRRHFTLYYAGMDIVDFPLQEKGTFMSPDSLRENIYRTSVRTLRLCMHEHYEDCPWREQGLYANDSRNQALSGYYAFGEYAFPAASFALFTEGQKDDGYLEMCAPAEIDHTIPSFSLAWILALGDHWLFSGDRNFIAGMMPIIRNMLDANLKRLENDMLPCPTGKKYWQFYDWADGLDGGGRLENGTIRFDAPLNLLFCMALDVSASLARECGNSGQAESWTCHAEKIRKHFHSMFWDSSRNSYRTYVGDGAIKHFSELTQSLAILARACPDDRMPELRALLASNDNGLVRTTLSQSIYKFEALLTDKPNYGKWVFNSISKDWGHMLSCGATSFWETLKGSSDFNNAGSLCHGWSAIPVYFYLAHLLGIRPLEPGFRRFTIDPAPGVAIWTKGNVPTPFGIISISWEISGDKYYYKLECPAETRPVLSQNAKWMHLQDDAHIPSCS